MSFNKVPTAYVVVDLEYLFDREAHRRYAEGERDDKESKLRWPFCRVVAASAMTLNVVGEQVEAGIKPGPLVTWGRPEMTEKMIVSALFDHLRAVPDAVLVTWGGEYKDVPVLRAAALELGLRLPPQMQASVPYLRGGRRHLDLAIAVKGSADFVHLGELATRLGVPAKPALKPWEVGPAAERGRWSEVKTQAEADVVTTALLAGRHLYATGAVDTTPFGIDTAIASRVIGSHTHRAFTADLAAWLAARTQAATTEAWFAHERLAA